MRGSSSVMQLFRFKEKLCQHPNKFQPKKLTENNKLCASPNEKANQENAGSVKRNN